MNVVILGGCGFTGSYLAKSLVDRDIRVRLFDRKDVDRNRIAAFASKVEIIEGDLAHEAEIAKALDGMDIVVHLACTTLPASSNTDPIYDVETNVLATIRMLDWAVKLKIKRVIFASSGGTIYGPAKILPIEEEHPTEPICSYGIQKLAIEKYMALFGKLHGLDWVSLRTSNLYGKGQKADSGQGAVTAFAQAVKRGDPISLWGDGSVVRDYLHISDLVEAYLKVIEISPPSRIYNIGTARGVSLNNLIKFIAQASGKTPSVTYSPSRPLDVPANVLDCSRAITELGWKPKLKLEVGLLDYFQEE